eukprot:287560_1
MKNLIALVCTYTCIGFVIPAAKAECQASAPYSKYCVSESDYGFDGTYRYVRKDDNGCPYFQNNNYTLFYETDYWDTETKWWALKGCRDPHDCSYDQCINKKPYPSKLSDCNGAWYEQAMTVTECGWIWWYDLIIGGIALLIVLGFCCKWYSNNSQQSKEYNFNFEAMDQSGADGNQIEDESKSTGNVQVKPDIIHIINYQS